VAANGRYARRGQRRFGGYGEHRGGEGGGTRPRTPPPGATVRAVLSAGAQGIVHPWAAEYATDNPTVTEITGAVEHVELCGREGWADVLLIAPATANTVGKMAAAVDDTPVTTAATTALGADLPVVVAPAMHGPMYDHPGVLEAIDRLESWGVDFVDPRIEEGKAKIATEDAVVLAVARATGDRPLAGREVVVTSGTTAERIDPVRVLTTRASGRTGRAVAAACHALGADVRLVHGAVGPAPAGDPGAGVDISYADVTHVESVAEMIAAVEDAARGTDALVSAAAISDYTVEGRDEKIPSGQQLTLDLEPTPKLLETVRETHPDLPIVGFKVETGADDNVLIDRARALLDRTGLAFVVANDAGVMGADRTRALLVGPDDHDVVDGTKDKLGIQVARKLAGRLSTE